MKKISFNDYIPEEIADNESCRLITTEQYQEYLKLKEEHKPLSWEELKEEAKKMDETNDKNRIDIGDISFYEDGQIWVFAGCSKSNISCDRTPDQMLAIMKALQ